MAGPVLDLGLQGGRWQLYRDPPRPPPVGVAVEGNGGDALMSLLLLIYPLFSVKISLVVTFLSHTS